MQNIHPTMRPFLAPFAPPSYYTLHPDLDAARWEADQDAKAEREEAERVERLERLENAFMAALQAGRPLPPLAIGADLDSLICNRIGLVEQVLQAVARDPQTSALLQPLAEAWAREVESCT